MCIKITKEARIYSGVKTVFSIMVLGKLDRHIQKNENGSLKSFCTAKETSNKTKNLLNGKIYLPMIYLIRKG